jgi:ribosomal protein L11 methyltransferase
MKRQPLWKISAATTPEAEDALADLLQNQFGQPATSCTGVETGRTTVTVYLPKRPDWPGRSRTSLLAGLTRIKDCGLNIGQGKISLQKIRRQDWAESWKRHFKPIEIGAALLIKPSWNKRRARKGQSVVVLDPGLSFGTGQHPTTAFCLRQLAARRKQDKPQSFLDIGTGSGILAIAGAKLGYAPVEALDFDPGAVRIARANARRNRVLDRVRIRRADVSKLSRRCPKKHHLVCANLTASLLLTERERILARLRPDGVLVLAGILKAEFATVQQAHENAGFELIASQTEKEWRSGAFVFK